MRRLSKLRPNAFADENDLNPLPRKIGWVGVDKNTYPFRAPKVTYKDTDDRLDIFRGEFPTEIRA